MSICGHIRGPFAAAAARESQIAIATNAIADGRTAEGASKGSQPSLSLSLSLSLPPSLIHSICKHRAIPCLRNQLSLAAEEEEG